MEAEFGGSGAVKETEKKKDVMVRHIRVNYSGTLVFPLPLFFLGKNEAHAGACVPVDALVLIP